VITDEFSSEDAIQIDIDTGPITRDEVSKAISNLKNSIRWHSSELIKAAVKQQ